MSAELTGEQRLRDLFDRDEITTRMITYARALDAHDWDRLTEVFTPDAFADYEIAGSNDGLDEIIETCKTALCGLTSSQHLVGNFVVDVNGDVATGSCYLHAQHFLVSGSGVNTFVVAGTYTDQWIRTDQGWRIKHRHLSTTWTDGNAGIFAEAAARLESGEASK